MIYALIIYLFIGYSLGLLVAGMTINSASNAIYYRRRDTVYIFALYLVGWIVIASIASYQMIRDAKK